MCHKPPNPKMNNDQNELYFFTISCARISFTEEETQDLVSGYSESSFSSSCWGSFGSSSRAFSKASWACFDLFSSAAISP